MAERVAVVTGGAGAIGGAIVAALTAAGHRTVAVDRDECDLADAADATPAGAVGRAISAGRRSCMAFQTARSAS